MTLRACLAILILCPGVGCSAAGTGDEPPYVVTDGESDSLTPPAEAAAAAPASAPSLPDAPQAPPAVQGEAEPCALLAASLTPLSEPVDFILVLDNAASMEDALRAAEVSLNESFGKRLAESGVDYRVILLSEHRGSEDQESAVCIQSPLSALATCPSPEPGENARFFHYSTEVESEDSLDLLLETFSGEREDDFGLANLGWSEWLRPDAKKIFLVLTADDADMPAMEFAAALTELAPEQFGQDPSRFNFTWHSIVGLAAPAGASLEPAAQGHLPGAPITEDECEGDVSNAGETYQELSRLTGGLRFPICETEAYGVVFQQIVEGVARGTPSCDFALPAAPPGRSLELGGAALSLGAAPRLIRRADDAASCAADAFYLTGEVVHLCPETCAALTAGADSAPQLRFTCRSPAP